MNSFAELLQASAQLHKHLCPRQVIGVRMGILAGKVLALDLPQTDKRLFTIVETDGCAADGVSAAANCWVGHRTLRIEDYGKVAATFVDTKTGRAIRIVPRAAARVTAQAYAPEAQNKWEAQLLGYQRMPADELLCAQTVHLNLSIEAIISRAGAKAICALCGEEILNEREIILDGKTLCRSCAGSSYYSFVAESNLPSSARCPYPIAVP